MLLLMGFMYSVQGGPLTLNYVDNDHSQTSAAFLDSLNATGAVTLSAGNKRRSGAVAQRWPRSALTSRSRKDSKTTEALRRRSSSTMIRSQSTSMVLITIVQQVADAFNLKMAGARGAHRRTAAGCRHLCREAAGLRAAGHYRHVAHDVLDHQHGRRQRKEQGERRVP